MVTVIHYTVEKVSGAYRIRARDPPMCPACGVLLSGYDTRPRWVVDSSGAVLLFQLRRLRCPSCHRLHLELPDFMRPYKHYASPVIEAVEAGATASCPADNSTMRRWKKSPTHFACPSSPGADTIGAADEEGGELHA